MLADALHPVDLVSLARCFEELAWHEQGESTYRRALGLSLPPSVRVEALNRLAWMLKRQERRAEAAAHPACLRLRPTDAAPIPVSPQHPALRIAPAAAAHGAIGGQ